MQYPLKIIFVVVAFAFVAGFLAGKMEFSKIISASNRIEYESEVKQEEMAKEAIHEDHTIKVEKVIVYSKAQVPPCIPSSATGTQESTPHVPEVAEERTIVTYSNVRDAMSELGAKSSYNLALQQEAHEEIKESYSRQYHLGILFYLPIVSFYGQPTGNHIQIAINASRDLFLGFSGVVSYNIHKSEVGVGLAWNF